MRQRSISIPLAPPGAIVYESEYRSLCQAAFDEMRSLIPALNNLNSSRIEMGVEVIDGRLHLTLTFLESNQMELDLTPASRGAAKVFDSDPMLRMRYQVQCNLNNTIELLAQANCERPEALEELQRQLQVHRHRRTARLMRHKIGRRFELIAFGQPVPIYLPELSPVRLAETRTRLVGLVTDMRGNVSFRARSIQLLDEQGRIQRGPPASTKWVLQRVGDSRSIKSGQALHAAMERNQPIQVEGRLMVDANSNTNIGMQVEFIGVPDDTSPLTASARTG